MIVDRPRHRLAGDPPTVPHADPLRHGWTSRRPGKHFLQGEPPWPGRARASPRRLLQ